MNAANHFSSTEKNDIGFSSEQQRLLASSFFSDDGFFSQGFLLTLFFRTKLKGFVIVYTKVKAEALCIIRQMALCREEFVMCNYISVVIMMGKKGVEYQSML